MPTKTASAGSGGLERLAVMPPLSRRKASAGTGRSLSNGRTKDSAPSSAPLRTSKSRTRGKFDERRRHRDRDRRRSGPTRAPVRGHHGLRRGHGEPPGPGHRTGARGPDHGRRAHGYVGGGRLVRPAGGWRGGPTWTRPYAGSGIAARLPAGERRARPRWGGLEPGRHQPTRPARRPPASTARPLAAGRPGSITAGVAAKAHAPVVSVPAGWHPAARAATDHRRGRGRETGRRGAVDGLGPTPPPPTCRSGCCA